MIIPAAQEVQGLVGTKGGMTARQGASKACAGDKELEISGRFAAKVEFSKTDDKSTGIRDGRPRRSSPKAQHSYLALHWLLD